MRRVPLLLSALMWYGLLGAPFAWTTQHIVGYTLTEAVCSPIDDGLVLDTWTLVVTALAALAAVGGWVAAILAWRRTRDAGHELPESRVHFLSVIGMVSSPLFLAIILMSGAGVLILPECATR